MNFILDVIRDHQKPIIISSEFAHGADREPNEAILEFRKKGIIVYPSPDRAARVLARMYEYSRYRSRDAE
jgi:acyl-CoA synthetase (NDP forming)